MATRPSRRIVERREAHKRYKEDVERRGKAFFPHAMFHDTMMSFVVVLVIVALACIWYFDADGTEAGVLGPHFTEEADPGTTDFIPRPDWYFFFLFYLLRIFKWPESVILGTVGIPTLLLIVLFALPFIDLRRERRLLRRPVAIVTAIIVIVSMGVLTYKGATAEEALGSQLVAAVPEWAERQGFQGNEVAIQGATLYAETGCAQCHVYLGVGSANLGAPELTAIGEGDRGVDYFKNYVANPADFGNPVMPAFGEQFGGSLDDEQLTAVATFLDASKGADD